jgi:hypothetical protein
VPLAFCVHGVNLKPLTKTEKRKEKKREKGNEGVFLPPEFGRPEGVIAALAVRLRDVSLALAVPHQHDVDREVVHCGFFSSLLFFSKQNDGKKGGPSVARGKRMEDLSLCRSTLNSLNQIVPVSILGCIDECRT